MRKVWVFLLGMIVGGGLVSFGFKYHVVYAKDGLILVPKKHVGLHESYVDVRHWRPADWQSHPDLVHSLVAHGRSDLIGTPANELLRDMLRKFGNAEKEQDEFRVE